MLLACRTGPSPAAGRFMETIGPRLDPMRAGPPVARERRRSHRPVQICILREGPSHNKLLLFCPFITLCTAHEPNVMTSGAFVPPSTSMFFAMFCGES
jgi:hypothetical protein